jgi:hypothetical protein
MRDSVPNHTSALSAMEPPIGFPYIVPFLWDFNRRY